MKLLKSLTALSLLAFLFSACQNEANEIELQPTNGFTTLDNETSLQDYLNGLGGTNARTSSDLLDDLNTYHIYKIDRTQDDVEIFSIPSISNAFKTYILQIENGEYYGYSINLKPIGSWDGEMSNFTGEINFINLAGNTWRRAYLVEGENVNLNSGAENGRVEACYYSIDVFFSGYEDSDGNVVWTSVEFGDGTITCDDPPTGSLPPPPPSPLLEPKGGGTNPSTGVLLPDNCPEGSIISKDGCKCQFGEDESGNCLQEETDLDKIMECEELSDSQLNQLEGVVEDYLSDCLNVQMFEYVVGEEKKVCFKIGSTNGEPGSYNHLTSTISFANSNAINASVFGEEFFHTYQDVYYGGLSQYSNVGRSNIEFEAKLFHDLVYGEFQCCMVFSNSDVFTEYFIWLTEVTNDFSSLPNWDDISDNYFYYLDEFKKDKPDYDYPTDYTLQPGALLNLENC